MNKPKEDLIEEYITKYDMRGYWASEEYKEVIRKQINKKVVDFIKSVEKEAFKEGYDAAKEDYHILD